MFEPYVANLARSRGPRASVPGPRRPRRLGPVAYLRALGWLITTMAARYHGQMDNFGAPVLSFEDFAARRPDGRIVVTSGGFDPIHPGHISLLESSAEYGTVVAVVNGDGFLRAKKGRPFQDLQTRCLIVSAIRFVSYVVPFEIEGDLTVNEALRRLRPDVFTKGGDRVDAESIPEWDICKELGIEIVTGVGADKQWSSSWFLEAWSQAKR